MNRFKHRIALPKVCASSCADAALEFSRFIGQDITVQIRENQNLELLSALFIHQFCGHDVDIPVIHLDARVFLRHVIAQL